MDTHHPPRERGDILFLRHKTYMVKSNAQQSKTNVSFNSIALMNMLL